LSANIKNYSYRQYNNNSSGLSSGAIAGIVIGIVGAIIITVIAFILFRRISNKDISGNPISSSVDNTDVILKTGF
jgi:uncharacterized membrane protein YdjX (TVP38/TMEM64 family)